MTLTFTITVSKKLLRSCEELLSKSIAINGSCVNDLERLAFSVLVAEKERAHSDKVTVDSMEEEC